MPKHHINNNEKTFVFAPLIVFFSRKTDQFLELWINWIVFALGLVFSKKHAEKLGGFLRGKAGKNAILLILINGITGCVVVLTQFTIANELGVLIQGKYAYYCALGTYGAILVSFGRERTMVRDLVQYPENRCTTIGGTFILSLLLSFVFFIFLAVYVFFIEKDYGIAVWLVAIYQLLFMFRLQPVYDAEFLMARHAAYTMLQRLAFALSVWFTIVIFPGTLSIVLISIFFIVTCLVYLVFQFQEVKCKTGLILFTKANFTQSIRQFFINAPIAASTMILACYGSGLFIMVKFRSGEKELGIYSVGIQILLILEFIFLQISRIGNPTMARIAVPGTPLRTKYVTIGKYMAVMLATSVPGSVIAILFSDRLVALFLKPEYKDVANLLLPLGLFAIFYSMVLVFSQYVQSIRKDHLYFMTTFSGAVICMTLGWVLIPRYGASGAAWTYLISYAWVLLLYMSITLYFLRISSKTP